MRVFEAGPLRVRAAGGSDRDGGGPGPAIVLCHGYGAPGDDLCALHRVIDAGPGIRWLFPEAPLSLDVGMGMTGRAWWNIDLSRFEAAMRGGPQPDRTRELPEGMTAAAALLGQCMDALVGEHALDPSRTVIGGFSQGSMITTELTLFGGRDYAGLAILSGTLLCRDRWATAAATRLSAKKVLMTHGKSDPLLPFRDAEALRDVLTAAGADVTFVPFAGQHAIPARALDALGTYARAQLGTG
jgi:phospholipase/carboxylesterase